MQPKEEERTTSWQQEATRMRARRNASWLAGWHAARTDEQMAGI